MKQFIIWGFGILLLSMAFTQLTTLGYFNHTMSSYLLPMGDGVKPLTVFVFPLTLILMLMEFAGAVGYILLDRSNPIKSSMMKVGLAAMVVWFFLVLSILIRGAPIGYVGFFGERLRQVMGWPILLQSLVFVVWGWTAYVLSEQDEIN